MPSHGVFSRQKHIRDDCFSFVKCVSDVTVAQEGLGSSPDFFFCFNGVKSCNFRQNIHGNRTFMKVRDSVYGRRRDNPFGLGRDSGFSNIYTMFNTGERRKKYKSKMKTTFGTPLLPIRYPHKTPPLTNLWIRAC